LARHGGFDAIRHRFGIVARSGWAPAIAGLAAIALRLAVLPIEPAPTPAVHDEFSYLLAADTFAHGRLANPTHPLWQHFETMQIEHRPTYASMYPPFQGLSLATGRVLFGMPFGGVLLGIGLMCGAICWALRGWFSPGWAFLRGMLAAVRIGMFSYWGDSYWGGALAAAGGGFVFGAVPRMKRGGRGGDAATAALGIAMPANTRPYEGLVFTLATGMVMLADARRIHFVRLLPAIAAVLVPVVAGMAYYNWRVFGSPATLPYAIDRAAYAVAPYFIFQAPRPAPEYLHQNLRDYYARELNYFQHAVTFGGYRDVALNKLRAAWQFFLGPALTVPLIAVAWTWRSRKTRTFLFLAASLIAAMSLVPWFAPHYAAPATVVVCALVIQGLRALRQWRPGLTHAIPTICVAMAAVRIVMALLPIPFVLNYPMTWATTWSPHLEREAVERRLDALGGRHLVIVHYAPGHDPLKEYVFNGADIDGSEIVWAQDMGAGRNQELLRYFVGRRVWRLDPDVEPVRLTPY